jgi:hypothetical protein
MSWRVYKDEDGDTSQDACLQSVALIRSNVQTKEQPIFTRRWVTVARGDPESMLEIARALNAARFSMFDLNPPSMPGSKDETVLPTKSRRKSARKT